MDRAEADSKIEKYTEEQIDKMHWGNPFDEDIHPAYVMGHCFFYGIKGYEWDYEEAISRYSYAAQKGCEFAIEKLAEIQSIHADRHWRYQKDDDFRFHYHVRKIADHLFKTAFGERDAYFDQDLHDALAINSPLAEALHYHFDRHFHDLYYHHFGPKKVIRDTLLRNIPIRLEDECPPRVYGGQLDFERLARLTKDASECLRSMGECGKWLKDILEKASKAAREKDFKQVTDSAHELKMLLEELRHHFSPQTAGKLRKLLAEMRMAPYTMRVLGQYSPIEHCITLYLKTIYKSDIARIEGYEKAIQQVLAHELFHAFHHLNYDMRGIVKNMLDENGSMPFSEYIDRHDRTADIVMESLAACYELKYSHLINRESDKKRNQKRPANSDKYYEVRGVVKDIWESHDMTVWPYSGAKYLADNSSMFRSVFRESLYDMEEAYRFFDVSRDVETRWGLSLTAR